MKTLSHEPDPPAPREPVETNTCCDDPTPGKHGNRFYCEACDTEWVPAHWLGKAKDLYVTGAAERAEAGSPNRIKVLALALEAGVNFEEAIRRHAAEQYQTLTGEPPGA